MTPGSGHSHRSHTDPASSPAPRHRTPTTELEEQVLRAARELLSTEGPDALSMRRLAREADVAPMSLYNRFGGKQGIAEAIWIAGFDRLAEGFATLSATDPVARLREACERYRQFGLEDPATYAVMFERPFREFVPSGVAFEHAHDSFKGLADLVSVAIAAGALAVRDPVEVAQQLWCAAHGAVSLELRGMGFVDDRDELFTRMIDRLLDGLRTEPTAS